MKQRPRQPQRKRKKNRMPIYFALTLIFAFFCSFFLFNGAEPETKSAEDYLSSSSSSSSSYDDPSTDWELHSSRSTYSRSKTVEGALKVFSFPNFGTVKSTNEKEDSISKTYSGVSKLQVKNYVQKLKAANYQATAPENELTDSYSVQLQNRNNRLSVTVSWNGNGNYTSASVRVSAW